MQSLLTEEKQPANISSRLTPDRANEIALTAARCLRHPIAVAILIVAAFSAVGTFYLLADREVAAQQARIDESRAILARPMPDANALETELLGWEWSRDIAIGERVDRQFDSAILDVVLSLAAQSNLEPFSSGVRDDSIIVRAGKEFRSTPFFLKATGEVEDIERFLATFELGAVRSAEIQHSLITESDGQFTVEIDALSLSEFPASLPADIRGNEEETPPAAEAMSR